MVQRPRGLGRAPSHEPWTRNNRLISVFIIDCPNHVMNSQKMLLIGRVMPLIRWMMSWIRRMVFFISWIMRCLQLMKKLCGSANRMGQWKPARRRWGARICHGDPLGSLWFSNWPSRPSISSPGALAHLFDSGLSSSLIRTSFFSCASRFHIFDIWDRE